MLPFAFALVVSPLLAAAALSFDFGSAQPPVTVEAGFRIHAVAKRLASPLNAAPALHWVADPFPDASSVLVSDPVVRTDVVALLAQLAKGEPPCSIWVLENSQTCTLGARIERGLAVFSFHVRDNLDLLDPPDVEGREVLVTLRVDYVARPADQARRVGSLAVTVATENVRPDGAQIALTQTARDAAVRTGMPPPTNFLEVPITVRITETDRVRPGRELFSVEALQTELFRAGLSALRVAAETGIALNQPAPGDKQLSDIDDRIQELYRMERPPWPAPRASTKYVGSDVFIELTRLRLLSRVEVEVHPAVIEREGKRYTFQGLTPAGEAKLVALRKEAADDARARLNASRSLEGTLPTQAAINELRNELDQQPNIRVMDVLSDPDGTVTFSSTFRDVDSELGAKVDLQATLDPEQFLTGAATLHEHNLLYVLLRRNIQEDVDLTANGGPQVQDVSADLRIARERGTTHVFGYGFTARTFFERDSNQRFGNISAIGASQHLIDQEWGETPKLFLQYEWRGGWSNRLRWEGGLDWRHVLIRPELSALPPLVDGHLTAWDNSIEEQISHDFAPPGRTAGGGVSEVALSATGVFRRATRQLSGDFDFSRPEISTTVEGLFGWRTRRELLIRYGWTSGSSSSGTPLFQLYRLGGAANVRGLEEGEYVGRSLRAGQLTTGIGLPVLWPALAESAASPLAGSYLMLFYDRGRVTLDDLTNDAYSYGVGVEIRNLPAGERRAHISIGWARSPQSVLHRHGVLTMGVRFSF